MEEGQAVAIWGVLEIRQHKCVIMRFVLPFFYMKKDIIFVTFQGYYASYGQDKEVTEWR